MAITTGKQFKVYEQASDGSGCGAILASFSAKDGDDEGAAMAAECEAGRLARENPGTRYFVLENRSAVYAHDGGQVTIRQYPAHADARCGD